MSHHIRGFDDAGEKRRVIDETGSEIPDGGGHSGQWGLASVLLSSLVIILFPLAVLLLFAGMMGAYEDPFVESRDIDLGVSALLVLVGGLLATAVFALVCGVVGLVIARHRRQSVGLSLAGVVSSIVAVAVAVMLLLIHLRSVEWVRSLQKARFGPGGIQRPTPEQLRR
jgi:hypothetical protein